MEDIITKLKALGTQEIKRNETVWKNWSSEEIAKLLDIYNVICQNEEHIYSLVYSLHGSDSFEDIFRDYDYRLLEDKAQGVAEALDCANLILKEKNNKK